MDTWRQFFEQLFHRFGDEETVTHRADWSINLPVPPHLWSLLAVRSSVREFKSEPLDLSELRTLAALSLAAPTKSDVQQRDIVLVRDQQQLNKLKQLLKEQAWISGAPTLVVFCANNRRQRILHRMRGHAFANDHLDAFFNATVDAAIALAAFVLAAEEAGFGTCPISAIRNRAGEVSALLDLPDHVFPVAGLAVGVPAEKPEPRLRLPLAATVHVDRYDETDPAVHIRDYDERRARLQPAGAQRYPELFEPADPYTWSEDKARQYSQPERSDFGTFIRAKGFNLD